MSTAAILKALSTVNTISLQPCNQLHKSSQVINALDPI